MELFCVFPIGYFGINENEKNINFYCYNGYFFGSNYLYSKKSFVV